MTPSDLAPDASCTTPPPALSFVPRAENIPRRSTSPLNVDQRVRTIAAVLQARVAGWPLDHTGPQTLTGLLRRSPRRDC